jgi:hypothetical protein
LVRHHTAGELSHAGTVTHPETCRRGAGLVCFFVSKGFCEKEITTTLMRAGVDDARQQDVRVIEEYPIEPKRPRMPAIIAWTGLPRPFGKLVLCRCSGGDTGSAAFWSLKPP